MPIAQGWVTTWVTARWLLLAVLILSGCSGSRQSARIGDANSIECAPFARQMTGIELYGDAASWWDQAGSRYDRQNTPVEGSVLVFRRSGRLPSGHVSVVARLISDRKIEVTQANWVHHRITHSEPVVDISPTNDWSMVRVWWAPANALGTGGYPTYGFIVPPGFAR